MPLRVSRVPAALLFRIRLVHPCVAGAAPPLAPSRVCLEGAMILGLSIETFTLLHLIISLVAIAAGLVVVAGMFSSCGLTGWTALFLVATVLTSVTGLMFPISVVTPAVLFGIISLVVLAPALIALYVFRLVGAWRLVYVIGALFALYLNVFVAVVQAFQKWPPLQDLAPTQSEPPFLIAQALLLLMFLAVGFAAVLRFRPMRVIA
jgi:hypothetical protein